MASAKDIYEAKVYAANIYAAGVFRGVGSGVVSPPTTFDLEWTTPPLQLHFTTKDNRLHYTTPPLQLHFTTDEP